MQRAALYARVSTKAQKDEGTSLDTQLEAMRGWASQNGYEVAYEFSEDFTGREIDRLELNRLKDLAQRGAINAVLIYAWDRLARDTDDQVLLRVFFERQCHVELICTTQPQMGEMAAMVYRTIMGMAAQIENDLRRERSMRGIRRLAIEKGQLPSGGQGLYGYDYRPKSKGGDGKRTINEEEARVVDLVFRWFVEERLSIYKIAKRLEEMGIRTKKGKKRWSYSVLDRLLRNPVYCGKAYAYRWETVEPKRPLKANRRSKKSSTRLRPEEDWIPLSEGSTPAIVTEELWEAAQKRLRENFKMRRDPKYPYLLRGMVECFCGRKMAASSTSERYRYYRCSAKRGVDVAHHFLVPAGPLEDAVWRGVKSTLSDSLPISHQLEKEAESGDGILRERILELEKAVADLEAREERLVYLYSLGKIDESYIDKETGRVQTERRAWEKELAELNERLQTKLQLVAYKDQIIEIVEAIYAELGDATFERKREILGMLNLRVHMKGPHTGKVVWRGIELDTQVPQIAGILPSGRHITDAWKVEEVGNLKTGETVIASRVGEKPFVVLFDFASICTMFPSLSPWGSQNLHPPPSPIPRDPCGTGILSLRDPLG